MKNNIFGKRIKALREDKGYSQQQLAFKLEVTQQTIWQWERGKTEPTLDNLIKIADVLWTTTDYLLGRV